MKKWFLSFLKTFANRKKSARQEIESGLKRQESILNELTRLNLQSLEAEK
ncbi:MAG: hypothetical protein LCH54_04015 [Bacteroidetes bacterium]|nr:hypothetical protein [Bacteroidota bacterium]MCA0445376.1 hypothetical protein [Bacteroidota bacterium]